MPNTILVEYHRVKLAVLLHLLLFQAFSTVCKLKSLTLSLYKNPSIYLHFLISSKRKKKKKKNQTQQHIFLKQQTLFNMMKNGQKIAGAAALEEVVVKMPAGAESNNKVVAAEMETMNGRLSGPLVGGAAATLNPFGRKAEVLHLGLRLLSMVCSVFALSFMLTAHQSGSVSFYGFMLPISSKWSYSHSFEYLVGASVAAAAHSLLQLLISASRLVRKSPVIPSRSHAWIIFAGDQVFAYAMISAGAAASGVTNLNRTGIQHTALPDFCKPLGRFCDYVAVSIFFTFSSGFLLSATAVQEVVWLSKAKF